MMSRLRTALIVATTVVACAGCAMPGTEQPEPQEETSGGPGVAPVLVVEGDTVDSTGQRIGATVAPPAGSDTSTEISDISKATSYSTVTYEAPPLLSDGTIDDGPDPFDRAVVTQPQPIPIENDPTTTKAVDLWSQQNRRVDPDDWDAWMSQSPWSQRVDPVTASIVKVYVERCGGGQTVATGVVLANETVVTTVHAIAHSERRVRVSSAIGGGYRIPAMVRYMDVDNDIAVLKVPGLKLKPMLYHVVRGKDPVWSYAYGVARGGTDGLLRRTPAIAAVQESVIDIEQRDGFAERIWDRSVFPMVGGITTGFSGGVLAATNDSARVSGWGFHGLIRARVPYRSETGGIVIPARLVGDALNANDKLDTWVERRPGNCPRWLR